MSREVHVRFCEGLGVRFPRATRHIIADADGLGRLIGFVYAVDMLESRHKMRWSHGGADNIYIDGMGDQPSFLRGIGGEDVFGASHGGAKAIALNVVGKQEFF